eukprot:m.157629 g.157629  ORF g.157629 m.157629 type:complete len:51 (+) comp15121_c3_seq1:2865-3017(+)
MVVSLINSYERRPASVSFYMNITKKNIALLLQTMFIYFGLQYIVAKTVIK